jgi:hypothetical protein
MEHFVEVYNLFYRIGWPGLLSVPESGIGDEDLFRGIGKDKFIIEFYPTNLIVWKNASIEVRLLDIQEGKLLYGVPTLKCSLLPGDGHIFSSMLGKN